MYETTDIFVKTVDQIMEKLHSILFLYVIMAARFLCAQQWKDLTIPTMEDCLSFLMELAEMAILTVLIIQKTLAKFNINWKPLLDFLQKRNEVMTYGFQY